MITYSMCISIFNPKNKCLRENNPHLTEGKIEHRMVSYLPGVNKPFQKKNHISILLTGCLAFDLKG